VKLRNETRYHTRVLRSLITAVYRVVAKAEGTARWWPRLMVYVQYRRAETFREGKAHLHGGPMWLMLPKPGRQSRYMRVNGQPYEEGAERIPNLVDTIAHELLHCYGYTHGQFQTTSYDFTRLLARFGGTEARLPERPPAAPRPRRNLIQERYTRLLARQAAWKQKQHRADQALVKIRQQLRYYERKLAAKSSASQPE